MPKPALARKLSARVLTCLLAWSAAAATRAEDPPAAAAPEPVAAKNTRDFTNANSLAAVKDYCAGRGFAVVEQGDGPVRLILAGGAKLDGAAKGLALAKQAMDGMEVWTGSQETFISAKPAPQEIYWLVLFASGDQVAGWIDYLRGKGAMGQPEGDDLLKKYLAFPGGRCYFTHVQHIEKLVEPWMVYSASCMAIDAFYAARGKNLHAPAWLREGMAAEMQRTLCQRILCTTIAYEDKAFPMSESWANDVARLIKSGDRQGKPACELMRLSLESLPNVFYQQMWSLCAFVRAASANKKGPENKLRRLLDLTAAGTDSEHAVKEIYGKSDPTLTNAWRKWALEQK